MSEALKPCPFCGGIAYIRLSKVTYCQLHGEPSQDYIVGCKHQRPEFTSETNAKLKNCKARPQVSAGMKDHAIVLWNARTPDITTLLTDPEMVEDVREAIEGVFEGPKIPWLEDAAKAALSAIVKRLEPNTQQHGGGE